MSYTTVLSPRAPSRQAEFADLRSSPGLRRYLPVVLYSLMTLLTAAWLLSLPVFPSQDGPLHRYYVHIFSELLTRQRTLYTDLYAVRHWLPPYATYYYSLVAIGHLVPLETADKLLVTLSVLLFAASGFLLLRTVAPHSPWAPFLLLPVLLNWPTFMGFVNYTLSIDLACFAITAWLLASRNPASLRFPALFLSAMLLIVFTHPLSWAFVLGFVALDLALRLLNRGMASLRFREGLVLALALLPYFYLCHFRSPTRTIREQRFDASRHVWLSITPPGFLQRIHEQAFSLLHLQGIVLFLGHGPARPYRLAMNLLFAVMILLSLRAVLVTTATGGQSGASSARHLTLVWFAYGCVLALAVLVIPDNFGGGYFFSARLQLLVYLCFVAAAAQTLERWPALAQCLAGLSVALSAFVLLLAMRYIDPIARTVLTVLAIPPVPDRLTPGLLLRPVGVALPAHLNFDSFNWAPVDYLRRHELPLYNTAWLGEPLIPLELTPRGESLLDRTYFNQAPHFGEEPMWDPARSGQLLTHAAFALIQREAIKSTQNPFAMQGGSPVPARFAEGWTCRLDGGKHWYLCLPPASRPVLQDSRTSPGQPFPPAPTFQDDPAHFAR